MLFELVDIADALLEDRDILAHITETLDEGHGIVPEVDDH
jgi:hypothetical protein